MRRKIFVLFVTLLIISSGFFIEINDFDVKANPGGGGESGQNNETILDYGFVWKVTNDFSKVVHNTELWGDNENAIRKGRAFGTKGDYWCKDYIKSHLDDFGFDPVNEQKIGILPGENLRKPLWLCNYKIETCGYNITANHPNWPFTDDGHIPKNETFAIPSACINILPGSELGVLSYTHDFTNKRLINKVLNDKILLENLPSNNYLNVSSTKITEVDMIIGNVSYINDSQNLPADQENRVFLIDEESGCEEILNNITNMSGAILIYDDLSDSPYNANTANCTTSVARINKSETNMTLLIEKLENDTLVLASNIIDNETITYIHNFTYCDPWPWWPEYDFFIIYEFDGWDMFTIGSLFTYFLNIFLPSVGNYGHCQGVILYTDSYDTHIMESPKRAWRAWPDYNKPWEAYIAYGRFPAMQTFSINKTVGEWLVARVSDSSNTISGDFDQAANFVDAYNIETKITVDDSPNAEIVVISNRYDGWWGECPGDSGVGGGIILGIAKYLKDNNINPKINLNFLFTTGEEYLMRGAWYYSLSKSPDNHKIIRWIGTDQLGFNNDKSGQDTILSDNSSDGDGSIIDAIVDIYNLVEDSGYGYQRVLAENPAGTDEVAFRARNDLYELDGYECKTICVHKAKLRINEGQPGWSLHHHAGKNYTEGDSMKYIDRDDVNATFNYTWGIVKYYCVNPNSWFISNETTTFDSNDDENSFIDSVRTNFTVKSILPHDYTMVEALIQNGTDTFASNSMNFSVNSSGYTGSIAVSLPENASQGIYNYTIRLYNSTGWINDIINMEGVHFNESNTTHGLFLSPLNWSGNAPDISNINVSPNAVGFGFNVTISTDVVKSPEGGNVEAVKVFVFDPDFTMKNYTMSNTVNDTYEYLFNNTWKWGKYRYLIWAKDVNGNQSGSNQSIFNVNSEATVSVCTIKDSYSAGEIVNLTDPPGQSFSFSQNIGYEFMDDSEVLRIWNRFDSYYFNTSNGIQMTNHKDDHWSHNVLMLGYYNNDVWNLIYRSDDLSGFNKNINSDNETFVNATLWKDLTYQGYDFRLAIRYYLGVDDNELTVIPYIKNLDEDDIPYVLGFGWELKDIQVDMTSEFDYIDINGSSYYLNQTLDETYTDMDVASYYIQEDIYESMSKSLYLRWDNDLNYKVKVKSRSGQYNAPVTLFIRIGALDVDQEKYTEIFWYDSDQITYYFDSYDDIDEYWRNNPGYMVDGNVSSYASTTVFTDVELCDNNTCNGTYLGEISKVELRCNGYYTGTSIDLVLRPVYNGEDDGDDYTFDAPSGSGVWSSWFDITGDGGSMESWSWNDVSELDCDVQPSSGFGMYTLYCSKVECRVTYNQNDAPVVSNPYPGDTSTGISILPVLNITVSDSDDDLMNITWLSNSSGSWQVFGTSNNVNSGTYNMTFSNATENGKWWYWRVNVSDGLIYTISDNYSLYTGFESKIQNTGNMNMSGHLFIRIDFYNTSSEEWELETNVIDEKFTPRVINVSETLALDTIFNPENVNTNSFTHGNGTYRVYATLCDPWNNVLQVCDNSQYPPIWWYLKNTYEFTVTGL